jgi:hypothetical protein
MRVPESVNIVIPAWLVFAIAMELQHARAGNCSADCPAQVLLIELYELCPSLIPNPRGE